MGEGEVVHPKPGTTALPWVRFGLKASVLYVLLCSDLNVYAGAGR